jgi:hypothetical protein
LDGPSEKTFALRAAAGRKRRAVEFEDEPPIDRMFGLKERHGGGLRSRRGRALKQKTQAAPEDSKPQNARVHAHLYFLARW